MTRSTTGSVVAADGSPFTEEDATRVRAQLEYLLASGQFRSSRRCQLLLQYITERTLSGDTGQFKERTLGVAVFGREPNYDTNQDPIVRATAAEIRKKLAQYYQESAHANQVRVSLLPGSYIPSFHFPETALQPSPTLDVTVSPRPVHHYRTRWTYAIIALAVTVALAATYERLHKTPLEKFWGRMVGANGILFCVGQPAVFNLKSDRKQSDPWDRVLESPESWKATNAPIPSQDLLPMPGRYFAFGDTIALVHLVSFFDMRKTSFFIRNSNMVSFEDLKEHPAILIGAFDNEWTLRFDGPLRFSFERHFNNTGGAIESIRDRQHPERTQWQLTNPWPEWNMPKDYALISRLLDPSTDRMMVTMAGITQYGTVAASEFLSNPDYFALAERKLPSDWTKKNVQIVLQVPVVHGANGRPEVLAVYTW